MGEVLLPLSSAQPSPAAHDHLCTIDHLPHASYHSTLAATCPPLKAPHASRASARWASYSGLAMQNIIFFADLQSMNRSQSSCKTCRPQASTIPVVRMMLITGSMNAAVLPEPVWAQAIKSRPLSAMGIAYFCTGVGFLHAICTRKGAELHCLLDLLAHCLPHYMGAS